MKVISTFLLAFLSMNVGASDIDSWYQTKGGEYAIQEAIYGNLYATLANSQAGDLSIYLENWDEEGCKNVGEDVIGHDPLYINDKLIKISQNCNGNWRNYFPATSEGREYLLNEFVRKNNVVIRAYDDSYKFLFSAKGFSKIYKKEKLTASAI